MVPNIFLCKNILRIGPMPAQIKAKEMRYKILCIYKVYHWPEITQYDPASKLGGLISNYMNMFLKVKQQASGWQSDIDRDQYIHDASENEGINLNPDDIEVNPAL